MDVKILQTFSHEGTLFQIVVGIPEGAERNTQQPKMMLYSEWGLLANLDGPDILDIRVALDEIMKERKEQIERIKKNVAKDGTETKTR